jgi:hypothetical protein
VTGAYEWNPMPHRLDVRCPACRRRAEFEFATAVRIALRKDIAFFTSSATFEHRFFRRREISTSWHAALFYPGLHGGVRAIGSDLPEGYAATDWSHGKLLWRRHGLDVGSVVCAACGHRGKHALAWPADAFFQLDLRGETLWAFHRESALALRAFIASTARDRSKAKWRSFLLHVPSHFLGAKARAEVVKRLDRLLGSVRARDAGPTREGSERVRPGSGPSRRCGRSGAR